MEKKSKVLRSTEVDLISQYPYQAGLFINSPNGNVALCSGSIISSMFILTCAHCINGSISTNIFYGSKDLSQPDFSKSQQVESTNYRIHPQYKKYENDMALLKLNYPITFSGE